jgi:hypothetical protein
MEVHMATVDPKAKKDMAKNVALIKTAFRKAVSTKGKDGKGIAVAFAMARGQKKEEHKLLIDPRKRAQALLNDIQKANPKMKQLCCGTLTVEKVGGKYIASVKLIKRLGNADRIMNEALRVMQLPQYKAQMAKVKEDEEVLDITEEDLAVEVPEAGDDDELENARASDASDEDEDEDEDDRGATASEDDDAGTDEDDDKDSATDEDDSEDGEDDDEDADDDDEEEAEDEKPPIAAKGGAPLSPEKLATLQKLPHLYRGTHAAVSKQFEGLKSAIRKTYASEAPELIAEIDKGLGQIDKAIEGFDHSIAEEMEKAHAAKDEATRRAHLQKCQALHAKNIHFLASSPMLKHIENNPFGVQVPVVKTYAVSFQQIDKHLKDMLK